MGYLNSNISSDNEFAVWFSAFCQGAREADKKAEKGDAKAVWDKMITKHEISTFNLTINTRHKKVVCGDHGPDDVEIKEWLVEGADMRSTFKAKRKEVVSLVKQDKPIKENEYL
ncbi:hypothetical protein A0J61_04346 [Choanephora cucurbitarum]|uniref:Uncharacterized protein n=1 Tax=Choanephora cucurbitarum TaxID=101091 RepID=A0A1C7NER3_9FUNG|nr:hypothetical protein A0J61_04346 [Choanephora cucurbitarum]